MVSSTFLFFFSLMNSTPSHAVEPITEFNSQSVKLKIRSADTSKLHVRFYEYVLDSRFSNSAVKEGERLNDGYYSYSLANAKAPLYFTVFKGSSQDGSITPFMLNLYLVEPGDDITIDIIPSSHADKSINGRYNKSPINLTMKFTGKGSAKYQCRYESDTASLSIRKEKLVIDAEGNFISDNYYDAGYAASIQKLNKYKSQISKVAYDILSTDFFSKYEIMRLGSLNIYHFSYFKDTSTIRKIASKYQDKIDKTEKKLTLMAKITSSNYSQFVVDKAAIGMYKGGNSRRFKEDYIEDVYKSIKSFYSGELRDKALVFFVLTATKSQGGQKIMDQVFSVIQTEYCLDELNSFADQNSVGQPAYIFSLPDTSGKMVRLDDFKGKVIFIDFWFNGCKGCTQYYMKVVSKAEEIFRGNENVIFMTISIDTDKKKWIEGINSNRYTSREIINLYTEGKGSEHPLIRNYRVSTYPRPLLIDKNGKIYSNNFDELRTGGVSKLVETIEKALSEKADG